MLQVSELSVHYRSAGTAGYPALDHLSLKIGPGESVGILGESGCGKTTLCLGILGLLPVTAHVAGGSIQWDGRDLLRLTEEEMRQVRGEKISIVFQEPSLSLHPVMRVGDQVAAVFRAHLPIGRREARQRAEELLREIRLAPADQIYRAYPHELSGGQQQRIAIAQALACRPGLVIADEPTASLDLTTQAEVIELLRGLRARYNTSFLIVSHSPGVLAALADRVVVLSGGRVVEEGKCSDVFRTPQNEYTARLLRPFSGRASGAQA